MHAYPARGETGDDDAFARMCAEHRARLVAYCKRRLRTPEDAEDAAHEALMRAYRAMPSFDHSTDAWPWLRTIAARVCTDMQRRAARAAAPGLVEVQGPEDVHEQVVGRLRADILEDALGRLSPRYRSALLLREYGGWSYEEIAKAQGRSLPSVRSILTRGRRRLGTHVESVARSRGQWPLPGAVPPLRRLREHVRSWRDAVGRSTHVVGAAFELTSVAGRMLVAAPAVASMLSLSPVNTATTHLPAAATHERPVTATSPASMLPQVAFSHETRASVDVPSGNVTMATTANAGFGELETYARLDASTVVQGNAAPSARPPSGGPSITGNDQHLWVKYETTVLGDSYTAGTNIPCAYRPETTLMCSAVKPVLRAIPES